MKISDSYTGTCSCKIFIQGILILLFALCSIVGVLFYSASGQGVAIHVGSIGYTRLVQLASLAGQLATRGSEIDGAQERTDHPAEKYFNNTTARLNYKPDVDCPDKSSIITVTRPPDRPKNSDAERRYQYMLSFHYAEQLTQASRHFVSFVNLVAEWGMKAVEPLVVNSRLYGLHIPRTDMYKYSKLFDLSEANRKLGSCLLGQNQDTKVIFKLENFLANSYRNIVLVYFVTGMKFNNIVSKESDTYFKSRLRSAARAIIDCTDVGKSTGVTKSFEDRLNSQKLDPNVGHQVRFVVRRMICVDSHKTVSLTNLGNVIVQSWSSNYRESVLFIKWQGQRTAYKFDESSQKLMQKCKLDAMPHSTEVVNMSKLFLQSLAMEKPFLSVHLRIAKVIQNEAFYPGYIHCCIQRVLSVINTTLHEYDLKGTLVLSDSGTYGTDACFYGKRFMPKSLCKPYSDEILKNLSRGGIQVVEFDVKTFSGVPQNSGFASLVESHSLLQGDMLVMMGGGSFQGTMRKNFVRLYYQYSHNTSTAPDHSWISVCPDLVNSKETEKNNRKHKECEQ